MILGLLIYQGVTTGELQRMDPGHVQLNKGRDHPEIRNAKQIRSSVIIHWLKSYNLREVQYMAGHKYMSSAERYQLNNMDKLQGRPGKLDPLNINF